MAIIVEERDRSELLRAGIGGGVIAGLVLAGSEIIAAVAMGASWRTPFRLVSALLFGVRAFSPAFPTALMVVVGVALHMLLSMLFGVVFLWILAWTFQLSARAPLLLAYGALFGFLLWEVNFLAILPAFFPHVAARFGPVNQFVNGILAYTFFYGVVLGAFQARARAGVRAQWAA
ncbi:MAG TPA: hypothetical protein VF188_04830 [Longimicrobiales bacterium]